MIKKIHLIASCGTGMGTLACMLKEKGFLVTGSDENTYPPMSDVLEQKGIRLFDKYDARNLDHNPDIVIIGNAVTKDNIEAKEVLKRGIEYLSMPQAVNKFIAKDKKIILVTGTHGKTTTSAIMAHILHTAGLDPSFMIGGVLKDYGSGFRLGNGDYIVIEGDEYDTAFFDKGPKFMHYDPEITIITGIEFDHADIFENIDHIKKVFKIFVEKIKNSSDIIAFSENDNLNDILKQCRVDDAKLEKYGEKKSGDIKWFFSNHTQRESKTFFDIHGAKNKYSIQTNVMGRHNILNMVACAVAAKKANIEDKYVQRALQTFSGIKRRQEICGIENNIIVMDDFAHHPTAVKETIKAVKSFYKNKRLIAVFEPRTNTSMRNIFQKIYPNSFLMADMVCVCEPNIKKNIAPQDKFSIKKLVSDIKKRKIKAQDFRKADEIIDFLMPKLKQNDLVLIMSNGSFDNIHKKLLKKIKNNK